VTCLGYSDRIQHALAFAAKHAPSRRPAGRVVPHSPDLAGTGVALILASEGADESTLIAAILRPAVQGPRTQLERVPDKFGPEVGALLRTLRPLPLGWAVGMGGPDARDLALDLARGDDARASLVVLGEAVQTCGAWVTAARRLGSEYASGLPLDRAEAVGWLVGLAQALERGPAAHCTALVRDLRRLGVDLVRSLPSREA
jgi:hypothetical protein